MKLENFYKKGWANFHIYYLILIGLPVHQTSQLQIENGCNNRQVNPDLNVSEQRDIHDYYAEYNVYLIKFKF